MFSKGTKESTQAWLLCCLSLIVAALIAGIIMQFTRNVGLTVGIFVALFFGCLILFCCLINKGELKKGLETKTNIKQARLESSFRQSQVTKTPVSSFRPTQVNGKPSKIGCHVCGATYEKPVNYCNNCGAEIIKLNED